MPLTQEHLERAVQDVVISPTIPRVRWNRQKYSRNPDVGNVTETVAVWPGCTSLLTLPSTSEKLCVVSPVFFTVIDSV